MKKSIAVIMMLLAALCAITLASCGGDSSSTASSAASATASTTTTTTSTTAASAAETAAPAETASDEPVRFVIANSAEPESLDPSQIQGVPEHRIYEALFEGLVTIDPETADGIPGVAES